ncbi:Pentatricopeptide repeat-containing protein [Sesamum alatum]|uniref:Pentatricopeptide repeat-containing protein n=1 Tax=Sesamum alatum TaxID=300844 RepID=A0AAE1YDV6_9LAMI|nr:Pentatricopeptide repeat-containing protein [Sesamum alatum]
MKAAPTSLVPIPTFSHFTLAVQAIRRFMRAYITTNTPPDLHALIAMYWNNSCDVGVEAWRVFEAMDFHNVVTYNSMITGLSMHKQGDKAMDLFIGMRRNGIEFDHTTLLSLTGLALDIEVTTALIRGYSILGGEVGACHKLFLETSSIDRDVVLWTGIMMASAEREPEQTLVLFKQMLGEALFPDCYIFSVVLKACSNLVAKRNASALHCQVIIAGFLNVLELATGCTAALLLICNYRKRGRLYRNLKARLLSLGEFREE